LWHLPISERKREQRGSNNVKADPVKRMGAGKNFWSSKKGALLPCPKKGKKVSASRKRESNEERPSFKRKETQVFRTGNNSIYSRGGRTAKSKKKILNLD